MEVNHMEVDTIETKEEPTYLANKNKHSRDKNIV